MNLIVLVLSMNYFLFARLFYPIEISIYLCIFCKSVKQFKQPLPQRAMERLVQHGTSRIEMKEYNYFNYTITVLVSDSCHSF